MHAHARDITTRDRGSFLSRTAHAEEWKGFRVVSETREPPAPMLPYGPSSVTPQY